MYGIDSVTPTVCSLMKIQPPRGASAQPITEIIKASKGKTIKKVLLYAPDAIGEWLFQAHKDEFKDVMAEAPIQVPVRSMIPSYLRFVMEACSPG